MSNIAELGVQERQSLLSKLLDAVKQCQIRFGGRTELATESDSRVVCLCTQFETVLQHGIRRNSKGFLHLRPVTEMIKGLNLLNMETDVVFWHFVRMILNKHEYERYMLLKNINTDIGRGRAWLRSALNEHSLERYMHMMLADSNQISQFYEDWAFMMDEERSSMLPMMAAGLGSILFAININNSDLNVMRAVRSDNYPETVKNETEDDVLEPKPVISKLIRNNDGRKKKKKKRPSSQVVSFDDDEIKKEALRFIERIGECSSAPATCLSSPVQLTAEFPVFASIPMPSSQSITAEHMENDVCFNTKNLLVSESADVYEETGSMVLKDTTASIEEIANISLSNSESSSGGKEKQPPNSVPIILNNQSQPFRTSEIYISQNSNENNSFSVNLKNTYHDKFLPHLPSLSSATSFLPDMADQSDIHTRTTLTPVGDACVGELIPVNHIEDIPCSEDSLSIPSFGEDMDNAVAALAIAQRVPSWSVSSGSSHVTRKSSEPRSRSETLTMNAEELREAVLAVLQKKEEAEDQNNALRSLLDREMEMSSGLRAELAEVQKHHEEKVERLESKIQTVSRENELLKHQLRKYIAAVQTLKHDSSKLHELASVVVDVQPSIPEPKPYIDHQYEAGEYEKKLVQVAEMHGELMEFNERLHRLLLQREAALRRLREELIDLRGPLPDDNQTSDDDISITSDYDASSQTAMLRPLINVWIPSAFLTGRSADIHHVYQVYVRIRDDEWNVYRRYAQFYALHRFLKKKDPIVNTFDFPPKKTIGKKDAKVVEQRRRQLQHYLRCVLNWLLQTNADLSNSPDKETFITLLPFLGDQLPEQRKRNLSNTRLHLRGANSSPTNQDRATQHYTGL